MSEKLGTSGAQLARAFTTELRRQLKAQRLRLEARPAPKTAYVRLLVAGKTVAYVTPGARSARLDVGTDDGYRGLKIRSESDFDAAIAPVVARAKEAA